MSTILEYCKTCKRKHKVVWTFCSRIGCYGYTEPKSEKVVEQCNAVRKCDGCWAYDERYA